jgi:hypothetical protein
MSDLIIVEVVSVEASTITVDVIAAPPAIVAVDVIAPGPAAMVIEIAEVGSGPVGYPQLPEELRYVPISFPFSDLPPPGGMVNVPMGFDLEVPMGLLGTRTFAINTPTDDATFVLNWVTEVTSTELGTITIPAGGATIPILAGPGGKLQAGDVMQIVCPQEQDASLADVGITVLTVRQ